jgi:hypothetical protein
MISSSSSVAHTHTHTINIHEMCNESARHTRMNIFSLSHNFNKNDQERGEKK